MTHKANPEKVFTIPMMPLRNGLLTAGQQATIEETGLWRAENVSVALDGMLVKRPGVKQWGQTIKQPDVDATDSELTITADFLNGISSFTETDSSSTLISTTTNLGVLQTNVKQGTGGESYSLAYPVATLSTGSEWSVRFLFSGANLPAYDAAGTDPDTFAFRVRAQQSTETGKEFAIWSGGIYYKADADDTYTLVAGSANAGTGKWVTIEVQCDDAAGETNVYMDDVLLTSTALTSADLKDVALTGALDAFEFIWEVPGQDPTPANRAQYSTKIAMALYNDTISTPFTVRNVVAVTDFQYITLAGTKKRCLLAAAGDYIYHDNDLFNAWRPLQAKQYSDVYFTPYRRTMVWSDNNGAKIANIWQWNGYDDPDKLDTAPNLLFMTEHQQRLWGVEKSSSRVYFSGDRKPNVWYNPSPDNIEDEFSEILDAGYIEIPMKKRDAVTAVFGDFHDRVLIFTRRSVWQVAGFGVTSYQRSNLTQAVGCVNSRGVTQIENDVWFISDQGVYAASTVEQFGDIKSQAKSGPIQDLWSEDKNRERRIAKNRLDDALLRYNPQQDLVYMGVALSGDTNIESIYVMHKPTGNWYGPWEIETGAMENIEVASPVIEVMMHGDTSGRVGVTDHGYRADYGVEYTMTIESAILTGRSIHPSLVGQNKSWHKVRVYYLPRGDWEYDVTFWADGRASQTQSKNQIGLQKQYVLDSDMRIDLDPDGLLKSGQEFSMDEILLDEYGYGLVYKIEQDGLGHDLPLQGIEVELSASGHGVSYGNQ